VGNAGPDYVGTVADYFVKQRGRGSMLSPADLAIVAAWERDGVPLNVVLRGIAAAFRRNPAIRSVAGCRAAVTAELKRTRTL